MTWKRTWHLIKADIKRRAFSDGRSPGWKSALTISLSPPGLAVIIFRLQSYFFHNNVYPLSKILALVNIIFFGVEISSKAEIDGGFIIGHANGVTVHDNVIMGKNCVLMQQCGLGIREQPGVPVSELHLVIEDEVIVAAGARVFGSAVIGHHSLIAMNAVVLKSIPPYSVVAGVPARVIATMDRGVSYPDNRLVAHVQMFERHRERKTNFHTTLVLIREDLIHRAKIDGKSFSWLNYIKLFLNPPALAVVIFRLQHWLDGLGLVVFVKVLAIVNIVLFSVEIGSKAEIAGGLVLVHANGILIHHRTVIGKNCIFYHHNSVAIGPRRDFDALNHRVVIGDNVMIGAGARIVGNLSIGNNSTIGMNAMVNRSLPPGAVATGIPARVLKIADTEEKPPVADKLHNKHNGSRLRISFVDTLRLIKEDIAHRAKLDKKPCNLFYHLKVLLNPPALAVVIFRVQCWSTRNHLGFVAKLLAIMNIILFTVEIQSGADIGPGLVLAHANGIVINANAVIGRNCILMHQNTIVIGPRKGMDPENDRIVLEDDVIVGIGARLIGNIRIGRGTIIGANAVVTHSARPGSILVGVPARDKCSGRAALEDMI